MKYLKLFDTENAYKAYREGGGYIKPNVSLCDDNGKVHYNYSPFNGYSYVDLGLPSGTKWATQNVGARKPSDYGLYFQWGDTVGYSADQVGKDKQFSWNNYKWNPSGDGYIFTKYTTTGATLELEDDAAHVNMGGSWHMPSPTQIQELINTANTTSTWTSQDGVNGRLFTSKKDPSKSIFIPAAGSARNGSVMDSEISGIVWTSMLDTAYADSGKHLYFSVTNIILSGNYRDGIRYYGLSIRGVVG